MRSSRSVSTLPNPARTFWGILVSAVLFLGAMSLAALIAIQLGIVSAPGERIALGPWLMFEIIVGSAVGLSIGALCRWFTASSRAPPILAVSMFVLALLEAMEVTRHVGEGAIDAPVWLVWGAPLVLLLAISLGGRSGSERGKSDPSAPSNPKRSLVVTTAVATMKGMLK